jgi:succinate dehydrogenase / fumarate reductase flavoprotein subunit/fumarate reductase flavoprotein subunit
VSRAAYVEIRDGRGTENGAVLIDVTHLGAEFVEKNFTGMRDRCLRIGYDLARERVEVCPTAHFNMGGVRIDRNGFTNLEGLFAAGEDSSGVHGANRLGGNGVAESTVFGARVGEFIAGWVKHRAHDEPLSDQLHTAQAAADRYLEANASGENPFLLRDTLGRTMWDKVGIVRDGPKLTAALAEIAALRDTAGQLRVGGGRGFNLAWQQALDLQNLLTAAELIARSALLREDSRGAHFRSDFEKTDNANWLKNIYLCRNGAETKSWSVPVKLTQLRP